MSSKSRSVPIGALIFPNDTQWAIAARVPTTVLDAAKKQLSDFLQTDGSRVVSGNKGMSVLLVFGGSLDEGEGLAAEISQKHKTSAYLLEFGDWASISQFDGARVKRKKVHPADFLESHGVIAPGYERRLFSAPPITTIGVVDDVTLAQAQRAMPKARDRFMANARGVLVNDESLESITLSKKLKRQSFTLFYDRRDGSFSCVVRSPDQQIEECFSSGKPSVMYTPIDSILGETTLDGILRVLDIPRRMLFPEGDATDQKATRRSES
jgi:hypothetical protein